MAQKYRRVAIIGSGPSGLSAVKALSDEGVFEAVRLFERRDRIGGTWLYDPEPDIFPTPVSKLPVSRQPPAQIPSLAPPAPEDTQARTGIYTGLDSNVGALPMAFTYKPFPTTNSALSIQKYGANNPFRPWKVIAGYIEDGFNDYRHLIQLNTTVERVVKEGDEWIVTLRKSNEPYRGHAQDYWWQERYDAVIVATGHYAVPLVPAIWGIDEAYKALPNKFEHSKSFRSAENYVGKKVIVVGGSISSVDLVTDLSPIVQAPLYVSQRTKNPLLEEGFKLNHVIEKPSIRRISSHNGGSVEFEDGSIVENFDKIIFATGYRLSYPFLSPDPVTPQNRLAGFYQHIFKNDDPSLAVVGQVKAAISFRVYEYQAVAVARFLAGRSGSLPSLEEQKDWEARRLEYKGPTNNFHAIRPDLEEYFTWLRNFAGKPAPGTKGYELPPWDDAWVSQGFELVLSLRDKHWKHLRSSHGTEIRAKL
ncbi:hypothetical protein B0O99DRAFT_537085 [Bisporella sp. PMI_857]|nr:hypothetical protein B0O99DRAFT_537085 [Bisporella sp. PMI_857]